MKLQFLPEGQLIHTEENKKNCASMETLRAAMLLGTVLEGIAVRCDAAHNLIVVCGEFEGIIPREECAMGIAEGTTREVAILSRVGKPVSFFVEDCSGDAPVFSRKRAQEAALAMLLEQTRVDMVLPAAITHLEPFGAFVDLGCGVTSMVSIEHISVSRIAHPRERFRVGQSIYVLVTGIDRNINRFILSHKELLGTWDENAAFFAAGETVTGFVRGVMDYGVFIELAPNLTGLSDASAGLMEGDRVSTFIKAILPESHKVKLRVIEVLPSIKGVAPLKYFTTGGMLHGWSYYDSPLI